jgi:hypothetical protein
MKSKRLLFQLRGSTHLTKGKDFGLWPTPDTMQRGRPQVALQMRENNLPLYTRLNKAGTNRQFSITDFAIYNGMLPTISTTDCNSPLTKKQKKKFLENRNKKQLKAIPSALNQLRQMAYDGMLPTPTCMDSTNATATMKSTQVKEGSMHSMTLTRAMESGMLPTPTAQIIKHGHSEKYWDNRIGKRQMDIAMWNAETNGKTSQLNPLFVAEMMGFPTDWTILPFQNGETKASKDMEMP